MKHKFLAALPLALAGLMLFTACAASADPERGTDTTLSADGTTTAAVATAAPVETGPAALLPDAVLADNAEYNGIVLLEVWPPEDVSAQNENTPVPLYLLSAEEGGYLPEIIDITTGRQLFVDDFLIEETTLEQIYHKPEKYEANPIFYPETAIELRSTDPGAAPISGGIWYDMEENLWKMWYEAGWNNRLAYATSTDGIHWERPAIQASGSNLVLPNVTVDSTTVYINYNADDPNERYLLFLRAPGGTETGAALYTSPDGIKWTRKATTDDLGDRSTIFYNPFRDKWVYSIRRSLAVTYKGHQIASQRARFYAEADDLLDGAKFAENSVFWLKTDSDDPREGTVAPQLYNFDAVG